MMVHACESIQRMEIASLIRFCFIMRAEMLHQKQRQLLFFTPCEELNGGSIFSMLAGEHNIVKPYLEKIDPDFINIMNQQIRNIQFYLNRHCFKFSNLSTAFKKRSIGDSVEIVSSEWSKSSGQVHMF